MELERLGIPPRNVLWRPSPNAKYPQLVIFSCLPYNCRYCLCQCSLLKPRDPFMWTCLKAFFFVLFRPRVYKSLWRSISLKGPHKLCERSCENPVAAHRVPDTAAPRAAPLPLPVALPPLQPSPPSDSIARTYWRSFVQRIQCGASPK